jgi:hypothetical protein
VEGYKIGAQSIEGLLFFTVESTEKRFFSSAVKTVAIKEEKVSNGRK